MLRPDFVLLAVAAIAALGAPAARCEAASPSGENLRHQLLFEGDPRPSIPPPSRLWRMRPEIYLALMAEISYGAPGILQPFASPPTDGFRDTAARGNIGEPATDILLRNAAIAVAAQGRSPRSGAIFDALTQETAPAESLIARAIDTQFRLALQRPPTTGERTRFLSLWRTCSAETDHPTATHTTLEAILMLPELLFRQELGSLQPDGRLRLTPRETARTINYALRNKIDPPLWKAAAGGTLTTDAHVASHVTRLLAAPPASNPRLLTFFREYFGYARALEVFKDPPPRGTHAPEILVADLDALILHILEEDRHVLRRLLTTNLAFVNSNAASGETAFATVYGFPPDWVPPPKQPLSLPHNQRAGILTHPAWLTAWSGNFDNDPVRRGKWIRTRLLGGRIPDVPIGVDASVPANPTRTYRQRLTAATSASECIRCHRRMDPLGLPFEQYDHYGRFRNFELGSPVDTSGTLDGKPIADPIALTRALAESPHVEQVFVRHVFRFFTGRDETRDDSATLRTSWHAYQNSRGSFRALVAHILTSEAFLYRTP